MFIRTAASFRQGARTLPRAYYTSEEVFAAEKDAIFGRLWSCVGRSSRLAQADRAAQFFGSQAVELGVTRLSIGICDTRACAERRDPPGAWFLYVRTNNGWKRSK